MPPEKQAEIEESEVEKDVPWAKYKQTSMSMDICLGTFFTAPLEMYINTRELGEKDYVDVYPLTYD